MHWHAKCLAYRLEPGTARVERQQSPGMRAHDLTKRRLQIKMDWHLVTWVPMPLLFLVGLSQGPAGIRDQGRITESPIRHRRARAYHLSWFGVKTRQSRAILFTTAVVILRAYVAIAWSLTRPLSATSDTVEDCRMLAVKVIAL